MATTSGTTLYKDKVIMIYDGQEFPLACCHSPKEAVAYLGMSYAHIMGYLARGSKITRTGYIIKRIKI